jgi:hypothetical protein
MRSVNGTSFCYPLQDLVRFPLAAIIVDVQDDFYYPEGHFSRQGKNLRSAIEAGPTVIAFLPVTKRVAFLRCSFASARKPEARATAAILGAWDHS